MNNSFPLLLASSSPYRAALLARLRLDFECVAAGVDEAERCGEAAAQRAQRLAQEKARALAADWPDFWIIGADQVASRDERILHKPGTVQACAAQLLACSGSRVRFDTAVCLLSPHGVVRSAADVTFVRFRVLQRDAVERYVAAEPAPDCAGGFKVEGLGISLFEEVQTRDPTGLVGLPLIALRRLLADAGCALP